MPTFQPLSKEEQRRRRGRTDSTTQHLKINPIHQMLQRITHISTHPSYESHEDRGRRRRRRREEARTEGRKQRVREERGCLPVSSMFLGW